jgi:hypothetical protein
MNAERLHAIALALREELAETEAAPLLDQLATALRQVVQEPSQPAHQQSVSSLRQRLDAALAAAPSNDFSPAWREAVEELGVADLLGERLHERVSSIFERNEITPSAAADELAEPNQRLQGLTEALDGLIAGFDYLGIGAEELPAGEFEVGFLVPRPAVKEELGSLGREFIELKRILGPFLELTTGTRPDLRVRSIASSEFQVLLESTPATALLLATALERLISSYEKVMNIRLAHKQLRESGASDETLAYVSKDAEKKMQTDIEALAEELVKHAEHVQLERANELRTEVRTALNALANRIDRGYSVEVRAGEPEDEDEAEGDEPDAETQRLREQTERVLAAQKRLSFRNPTGEPILELPEGTEDPDAPGLVG